MSININGCFSSTSILELEICCGESGSIPSPAGFDVSSATHHRKGCASWGTSAQLAREYLPHAINTPPGEFPQNLSKFYRPVLQDETFDTRKAPHFSLAAYPYHLQFATALSGTMEDFHLSAVSPLMFWKSRLSLQTYE
ncbi:hypothetical protein RRG08_036639 [Elysia crispata]|uniref:Uncharacterized protein n=1 Tax=Elysia crispata TaxID=231223 RepID=A0AAE0YR88_9GAST|nr:hypothetical protein RRG08_036639 [Elysia crispata]